MWWNLFNAIRKDDVLAAKELLDKEPQLAHQTGTGICQNSLLLHISTSENRTEISKLLISKMMKKDLSKADVMGCTAIYYTAKNGNLELCKLLFKLVPSSIYKIDCLGHNPLIVAAIGKHQEVCSFLFERACKDYVLHRERICGKYNFLHYATVNGLTGLLEMVLIKFPDLINSRFLDQFDNTLLDLAAKKGHTDICKLLITRSRYYEIENHESLYKALKLAAQEGHSETCQMFLDYFPGILSVIKTYNLPKSLTFNIDDPDDKMAYKKFVEKCEQFIKYNCKFTNKITVKLDDNNIEAWDFISRTCPKLIKNIKVDETLLHSAAMYGRTEVCKVLLSAYPWLIDVKVYIYSYAIDVAVSNGRSETCALLLSYSTVESPEATNSILLEELEGLKITGEADDILFGY